MNADAAILKLQADFEGVERVVADENKFKIKLAIGEDAYTSLRMTKRLRELWDIFGTAGTGAAVAKSSIVATTFFAPSGFLGVLGIGTAATPIGWVAFAAIASGGACYGLYRLLGNAKSGRVIEIPKFLTTPLDALGMALFDLITPLSLRMAAVDGKIGRKERAYLMSHLVDEWGLDHRFVRAGVKQIESEVITHSIEEMAKELATFLHLNPDCNQKDMAVAIGSFLQELLETEGPLCEQEHEALTIAQTVLESKPPSKLYETWEKARENAKELMNQAAGKLKKKSVE